MRSHSRLRNFFSRRNGEERGEHPVTAIESFVPLLLATHGVILLFWHGNTQPWQWLILGGLFVLGALRLSGWYEVAYLSYGRALYILLATWLLMYSTDGAASNFMLWNFVLVAVYPIILRFPSAPLLPPVVAAGYLLLFLAGPPVSLSLVTLFSRTFLLCFIGWLTYQLGTSLQRQAQTYRQAAEALAKEQHHLRVQIDFNQAVLDSLPAHIAVLDKEGVIVAVNQAWQRFAVENDSRSAAGTGIGANYLTVCDKAIGEFADEAPVVAANIRDVMAGHLSHFSLEYPCHSLTEQRWFLLNVAALLGGGGAVVSHTNITKRKAAEEALRQSEAHNRALVEAIPDAILRIHRDGAYLDFKTPQTFDTVRPVGELVGKKPHDVLPAAVAARVMDYNLRALATGERQTFEYELVVQGEKRVRESRVVPIAQDEVIVIVRDITEQRQTQELLRRERDFAQSLIATAQAIILVLDTQGRIVSFNPYLTAISGYQLAEVQGNDWFSTFLPLRDQQQIRLLFDQAIGGAPTRGIINTIVTKAGYELEIEWHDQTLKDADGHTLHLLAVGQDVTAQRQAERQLRASEQYNRALLAAIPDAIGRFHRDGACLDMRAPSNFAMTVPPAAAISKKLADYLPPTVAQQNMHAIAQALATGELQVVEYQLTGERGGQVREARIVPYAKDEVITIIRDITTRRLTEDALRKSEARNRALLEAIPDAVVRIHRNGAYLDAKDPADFVPVVSAEQVVGKHVRDLLEAPLAQQFLAVAQQALDKHERQIFEYELKIGEQVRMREARVVPVGEDETIFILRDITERKQAEAEKSRLYTEVSQQRAQLRALTGRLAEVQEEERKKLARELHDQVGQNLSTLGLHLKVIETQLATQTPAAGQIQPLLTDAQALVKQVTEQVRTVMTELRPPLLDDYGLPAALEWYANRIAKQAHFRVQMAAAEELPRLPTAIENGLFRIAQEAITNIMKYAQASLVVINLVINVVADAQQVTLTIADNGRGFDPTVLNHASERAGWGLLSMRERTEALGGRFTIESHPGKGTRVRVVIDRQPTEIVDGLRK